jgi:phosphoribosylformylglycinamidine synthase
MSAVESTPSSVYAVTVEVRLRPGIADPQGATIERACPALGFEGVSEVGVGKMIRFELESSDAEKASAEVQQLCERFLTNPVIEDSIVTIVPVNADGAA